MSASACVKRIGRRRRKGSPRCSQGWSGSSHSSVPKKTRRGGKRWPNSGLLRRRTGSSVPRRSGRSSNDPLPPRHRNRWSFYQQDTRGPPAGTGRNPSRQSDRNLHSDRKSTRLNSSHTVISYAVFCLKKKKEENKIF